MLSTKLEYLQGCYNNFAILKACDAEIKRADLAKE
jgi:hypothetical protein